jgi:hypothetical protein
VTAEESCDTRDEHASAVHRAPAGDITTRGFLPGVSSMQ